VIAHHPDQRPIRWGIVGCGDVTEVKSGPAFNRIDGSALVAVMRRTAALARDYAARHGVPRWYDDGEALVRDPEVDAVYVATPPDAHEHYVTLCARAGKPVYVEKPMALDAAQCRRMIDACRTAGVPLFTAFYRRALPRFLKLKALVDEGAIGEVRAVQVTLFRRFEPAAGERPWRVDPAVAGGGLFVDLASHTLDLLDYILGPIDEVAGGAANQAGWYEAEDIVHASLGFASGVRGTGLWCFTGTGDVDRIEILGGRGRLACATFDDVPIVLETAAGTAQFVAPHPPHVQQPLIQTIVDALRGRGACPSTGENGLRLAIVMDRLLQRYYRTRSS
jgi:predicted dehydrogenase